MEKQNDSTVNILGQETSRNKAGMRDPSEQSTDERGAQKEMAKHGVELTRGNELQHERGNKKREEE